MACGRWRLLAAGLFALLLARSETVKQAAWRGWLFGWAHFTFGNVWIADSFTHQAEMPALLGWLAVPLLAVYLAVYPALAALAARLLVRKDLRGGPGWAFALVFAGALDRHRMAARLGLHRLCVEPVRRWCCSARSTGRGWPRLRR